MQCQTGGDGARKVGCSTTKEEKEDNCQEDIQCCIGHKFGQFRVKNLQSLLLCMITNLIHNIPHTNMHLMDFLVRLPSKFLQKIYDELELDLNKCDLILTIHEILFQRTFMIVGTPSLYQESCVQFIHTCGYLSFVEISVRVRTFNECVLDDLLSLFPFDVCYNVLSKIKRQRHN